MQQDRLFFGVLIAVLGGVGSGSFFVWGSEIWVWGLLGGAMLLAIFVIFSTRLIGWGMLGLCLFGVSTWYTMESFRLWQVERISEGEINGEARIVRDPEEKSFYQAVTLAVERCEGGYCPPSLVLWQAPRSLALAAGDRVNLSCPLKRPENFDPDFDYRMYLAKEGIGLVCEKATDVRVLPEDWPGRLRRFLYIPKHFFERALSRSLSEPEAGLAKGLLLGGNDYLPATLKDIFARIGLTHIVAVSGYNITVIAELFVAFGLMCGLWRRQALWGALGVVVLFILMIGLPASAVRAGLMAGTAFLATHFGRLSRSVNSLLLAAAVMLLLNPLLLRYDVGFQLSFLATLGIILLSPWQERLLTKKEFFGKGLLEIAWLTFSAQVFVLPILLFQFQRFSVISLFANILLLPLVPYAMGSAFFVGLAQIGLPFIVPLLSFVAYVFLFILTRVPEWLDRFAFASQTVTGFGVREMLLWYGGLLLGIVWAEYAREKRIYAQEALQNHSRIH